MLDRLSNESTHHGANFAPGSAATATGFAAGHANSTAPIHPSIAAQAAAVGAVEEQMSALTEATGLETVSSASAENEIAQEIASGNPITVSTPPIDDSTAADKTEDEGLYSVSGFNI